MGSCLSKNKQNKISTTPQNENSKDNQIQKQKEKQKDQCNEEILQQEQSTTTMNQAKLLEAFSINLGDETKILSEQFVGQTCNDKANNESIAISEFIDELLYLELLGQGSFGQVHKVFSKKTGKFYAIKVLLKNDNEQENRKFLNEIEIMKKLNTLKNNNIIQIISLNSIVSDTVSQQNETHILMESGSCTLRDILNQGRTYQEAEIKSFLHDICIALNECQKIRIAHRDLKPENLILNQFHNSYIISDFGEAIILPENDDKIEEYFVGTPSYMSYEVFLEYLYWTNKAKQKDPNRRIIYNPFLADISSLGMIILELMGIDKNTRLEIRNGIQIPEKYKEKYSHIYPLVNSMMANTQAERPSYESILETIETWENYPFNDKQLAKGSKLKVYKKLDLEQLLDLAKLYSEIERYSENLVLCEYCFENYKKILTQKILQNLNLRYGEALLEDHQYNLAFDYFEKTLKLYENINSDDELSIAKLEKLLAQVCYFQNNIKDAENYLNKAQFQLQMLYGQNHPEFGEILLQKGQINYANENYKQARAAISGAIELFTKEKGNYLKSLAKAYRWVALVDIKENLPNDAIENLNKSSNINIECYQAQLNFEAVYINLTYAVAYRKAQNLDKKLEYENLGINLLKQLVGEINIQEFINKNKEIYIIQKMDKSDEIDGNFVQQIKKKLESIQQFMEEIEGNTNLKTCYMEQQRILKEKQNQQSQRQQQQLKQQMAEQQQCLQNQQIENQYYMERNQIVKRMVEMESMMKKFIDQENLDELIKMNLYELETIFTVIENCQAEVEKLIKNLMMNINVSYPREICIKMLLLKSWNCEKSIAYFNSN